MSKFLDKLYKNQSSVYKYFLYLLSIVLIVFFFPKGGKFKYEFQKGKPWQHENYYAEFDFSIKKTKANINAERAAIEKQQIKYYTYDADRVKEVYSDYSKRFHNTFTSAVPAEQRNALKRVGVTMLDRLYKNGFIADKTKKSINKELYLVKANEAVRIGNSDLNTSKDIPKVVKDVLLEKRLTGLTKNYEKLIKAVVKPNVFYDDKISKQELENELANISYTRGNIDKGKLIIAKGEVVEGENLQILESLEEEYESQLWTVNNYYFILLGYTILVALVLIMLLLFLKKYRRSIYENNTKVTFIFFNIWLMVFITTMVVKYNEAYIFVVPLCILPLILKTFFDARLGLYVHVLTVLILGFVVPNSFEYIFLQIIAGIVTILSVAQMYKRANLFVSVGQITLIYVVGYLAFHIIHEGNLDAIGWITVGFFLLNGMITLFAQPLIYIYEKIFGLISDVSLLELSDTNAKLLKELANKAPGTFHHSLQVANLAEAAANEIGANAMLARVGALYHDIGKMENPTYFTENQITNVNPHDDLQPKDSAKIILDHVIKGIELARKNNIPDRVIDFIRTHHGTNLVYYFYKKEQEGNDLVDASDFTYAGPIPFSRETAILMMADAVEAASKSLKNPTFLMINDFVDKIITTQMQANQFLNADITFKEIEAVKKVLKQKLTNIYHLRVEYPE